MHVEELLGPTVRAAVNASTPQLRHALENASVKPPRLLASFFYLQRKPFLDGLRMRDWVLDSGAFSAHYSGRPIDLLAFTEFAKNALAADPRLSEVYGLDVIGDWRRTRENTERMHAAGVPVIPCFHSGSPLEELDALAAQYPKIAIGGSARLKRQQKIEFARLCFDRVWRTVGPIPIHGFGFGADIYTQTFPFHSIDSSNWETRTFRFGSWRKFGTLKSVARSSADAGSEFVHIDEQEDAARVKWRNVMRKINENTVARFGKRLDEMLGAK